MIRSWIKTLTAWVRNQNSLQQWTKVRSVVQYHEISWDNKVYSNGQGNINNQWHTEQDISFMCSAWVSKLHTIVFSVVNFILDSSTTIIIFYCSVQLIIGCQGTAFDNSNLDDELWIRFSEHSIILYICLGLQILVISRPNICAFVVYSYTTLMWENKYPPFYRWRLNTEKYLACCIKAKAYGNFLGLKITINCLRTSNNLSFQIFAPGKFCDSKSKKPSVSCWSN